MRKTEKSNIAGVRVLLLEGFARQCLPMMEYLHKNGCIVTTYNNSRLDVGYVSRYPNKKLLRFWDRDDEDASYQELLKVLNENKYDVVIPLTDFSAIMLSKHKQELKSLANVAVNDYEILSKASNKQMTMNICADNNIPCPTTLRNVNSIEDVLSSELSFPLVIKPKVGYGSIGFHVIQNEEHLKKVVNENDINLQDYVVQEYIPQSGSQFRVEIMIDSNGIVKSGHVLEKARYYPIDGGSSCCAVSVDRQDILEMCVKLLGIMGWKGYADFDVIVDPRDNVPKVTEINPRITACVKICFKSGIDFAKQIIEFEMGKEVTSYAVQKYGNRIRYFHTDLLWFIKSKNRFKTKPSWFSWWRTCDQIWSIKDPLTWFSYTIQGLKKYKKEINKRKR